MPSPQVFQKWLISKLNELTYDKRIVIYDSNIDLGRKIVNIVISRSALITEF